MHNVKEKVPFNVLLQLGFASSYNGTIYPQHVNMLTPEASQLPGEHTRRVPLPQELSFLLLSLFIPWELNHLLGGEGLCVKGSSCLGNQDIFQSISEPTLYHVGVNILTIPFSHNAQCVI